MKRLGSDTIVLDLFAQFFHTIKYSLRASHFHKFDLDLFPVQFLIKIKDMSLYILFIRAYGRLDTHIGHAGIPHAIIRTVRDINAVWRRYHRIIDHNV